MWHFLPGAGPVSAHLKLREYQAECIRSLFLAWSEGMRRPAVVLPTGAGKTVIFSHLIQGWQTARDARYPARVIVLVHRDELADQAIAKIRAISPDLNVGKVKAQDQEIYADVMVCSVQTLARSSRLAVLLAAQQQAGRVGLIITDECFPAGTLVGGTPIEKLQPGDLVPTWNEDTGREELRPVVRAMRKAPLAMVSVSLEDGSSFTCTPNHPILTDRGWCPAGMLLRDAFVVSFTHDAKASGDPVHGVQSTRNADRQGEDRLVPVPGPGILLGSVQGRVGIPECVPAYDPDQSPVRLGADASEQPHGPAGEPGEDVGHAPPYQAQTEAAWRERFGSAGAAAQACGVPGLADRSGHRTGGRGTSVSLQGGHRAPIEEGTGRGRRGIPLLAGAPNLRPEAGRAAVRTRVADVSVLEPGGDGTYGGVCPDGAVYNIEVDTTHTYLINNGLVVHNCHHAPALSYQSIYRAFPDALHAGFTATLERGDGVGLGSAWEDVVYSRSPLWMMKHGYLVQPRAYTESVGLDLKGVKTSAGDYQSKDLGRALEESDLAGSLPAAYKEHAGQRQGVAFTPTVATAELLTEAFNEFGITAACVTGESPRDERRRIFEGSRRGKIQVLVNCMVLTEGFDAPWLSAAVIARPTRSRALYIQMVGRVLRPWRDKTDAIVLNVAGAGGRISTLVDLEPGAVEEIGEGEGLLEAEERELEEAAAEVPAPRSPRRIEFKEASSLFEASHQAWLTTRGGVMFISAGEYTFFLWPSVQGELGTWDVCWLDKRGNARVTPHSGLPVEMAMSWAEAEAEDYGSFSVSKNASWRRGKPSDAQLMYAHGLGIDTTDLGKAELSDAISIAKESRRLDPHLAALTS